MILFPEALRRFPLFTVLLLREASGWDEAKAFIPAAFNPLLAFVKKKKKTEISNRIRRLTGEL